MNINRSMGLLEWSLLLLLSVLWGGSFFFAKVAVAEIPPLLIVLGRVGIAAVLMLLLVQFTGDRLPRDGQTWRRFFVMGLLNNVIPFSLIFWGQIHIASGLASILNATTPLWTVLLAHWTTSDETLTPSRLFGVLLGICGAIVIIGPEALRGLGADVWAQLAVVGAAISYAIAGIFGRRFSTLSPTVTATGQVCCSTLVLIPLVLLLEPPWHLPNPSLTAWASLVGLALLCTVMAYLIYFRLLRTAGATNLLLVTFLIPVSALILGVFFLDERLAWGDACGMVLIGLGLVAMDGRLLRRLPSQLRGPV